MRLKPLDKIIKTTRRRSCPFCQELVLSHTTKSGTRVIKRRFTCSKCKSAFNYDRDNTHFKLASLDFRVDDYVFTNHYDTNKYEIIHSPISRFSGYVNPFNIETVLSTGEGVIPFSSTIKSKLEDKLQIFITFL